MSGICGSIVIGLGLLSLTAPILAYQSKQVVGRIISPGEVIQLTSSLVRGEPSGFIVRLHLCPSLLLRSGKLVVAGAMPQSRRDSLLGRICLD